MKRNFDLAKALNITDDVKNAIYDQLLKNIQAKLLDFVDNKLIQTEKGAPIVDSTIVGEMKETGICKSDAVVKDDATMKANSNDSVFFLKDIIGNRCFLKSNYQTMIADMFKHFHDKYEAKNDEVFKKKINEELKATDFTDNANTNLKIDANNNNECTYFEKKQFLLLLVGISLLQLSIK